MDFMLQNCISLKAYAVYKVNIIYKIEHMYNFFFLVLWNFDILVVLVLEKAIYLKYF